MKKYLPLLLILFLWVLEPAAAQQVTIASIRSQVVDFAKKFLGVPYVYGSANPSGFDCTGIVFYTYQKVADLTIPRATRFLAQFGKQITLGQALPGDILIFDTVGGPSHAGLYIGDNQVLHAASAGSKTGVIISKMSENYYASRFLYGRQILPVEGPKVQPEIPPETPDLPLTTLDVPVARRSLRNYDRIPFLSGTLVEFDIRQNRQESETFRISFVKGDYESGEYVTLWEENKSMAPGEVYRTRQTKVEGEAPWTLVVQSDLGEERALRIFRSVRS